MLRIPKTQLVFSLCLIFVKCEVQYFKKMLTYKYCSKTIPFFYYFWDAKIRILFKRTNFYSINLNSKIIKIMNIFNIFFHKLLNILFIILFFNHLVIADGSENFANLPISGPSYYSGSFVGNNGITWFYQSARGDKQTTANANKAICLRNDANSDVSVTFADGINSLSFQYEQPFTGKVNAEVYINGIKIGIITTNVINTTMYFSVNNLKIQGNVTLRIKNSSSGQVTIDDINWTSYIVNNNDETSSVLSGPKTDANLLSSTVDSYNLATYICDFSIHDAGTNDGKSTYIKKLIFKPSSNNKISDWTKIIGGMVIRGENPSDIIGGEISGIITNNEINFSCDKCIVVSDGTTKNMSIYAYLKTTVNDNDTLGFQIFGNEIVCDTSGSFFQSGQLVFLAQKIEVTSSNLNFQNVPVSVGVNDKFSLVITATDKNKNIDKDNVANITLSVNTGQGTIASPIGLTAKFENGVYSWNELIYNKIESFSLKMFSLGIPTSVSSSIISLGDKTSYISTAKLVENNNISSLANQRGEAVEIFRFKIHDNGYKDGLPTKIKKMNFKNNFPSNNADWTNSIQGVVLKNKNFEINIQNLVINDSYISFFIPDNEITLNNNDSLELSLCVYLNFNKINMINL